MGKRNTDGVISELADVREGSVDAFIVAIGVELSEIVVLVLGFQLHSGFNLERLDGAHVDHTGNPFSFKRCIRRFVHVNTRHDF